MTYPIHHETIVAKLAPEDSEESGRFDVLQTGAKEFDILDGGAVPAGSETTLRKAVKEARRLAAAYDRDKRAAAKAAKAGDVYVTNVTIAVRAGSEVEATAAVARILDGSGGVANWHFRTFAKDGATYVTLPKRTSEAKAASGNIDALGPQQGLFGPALAEAAAKLSGEVAAHLDYESDDDMQDAKEAFDTAVAAALDPKG